MIKGLLIIGGVFFLAILFHIVGWLHAIDDKLIIQKRQLELALFQKQAFEQVLIKQQKIELLEAQIAIMQEDVQAINTYIEFLQQALRQSEKFNAQNYQKKI